MAKFVAAPSLLYDWMIMKNPACKYAMTMHEIDPEGPAAVQSLQTTFGMINVINFVVYDLEAGDMFSHFGVFVGKPYKNDADEWLCSTVGGVHVNLADIGIVPRPDGSWASVFTWTDITAPRIMQAAVNGELPSALLNGASVIIHEP